MAKVESATVVKYVGLAAARLQVVFTQEDFKELGKKNLAVQLYGKENFSIVEDRVKVRVSSQWF